MRAWARLRSSGALWVLAVLVAWIVAYDLTGTSPVSARADQVALGAATHLVWIVVAVSVVATVSGARTRREDWPQDASGRPLLAVLADVVWPATAVGVVGLVVALLMRAQVTGVTGGLDVRPVVVPLLVVVAAAVTSCAVARWLPLWYAIFVSPVAWYVALAFTPAMEQPWPRHLVTFDECCGPMTELDPRVYVATTLCAVGLTVLGGVLLAAGRRLAGRAVVSACVGVAALVVAVGVALPLDYNPVVVRDDALDCVRGGRTAVEICVFPEEAAARDEVLAVADAGLAAVVAETGAGLPATASQRPAGSAERLLDSVDGSDPAAERGARLAAQAAFPMIGDTCWDELVARYAARPGFEEVAAVDRVGAAWWAGRLRGGADGVDGTPSEVPVAADDLGDPLVASTLATISAWTPRAQGRWMTEAAEAIDGCDLEAMEALAASAGAAPRDGGR